MKWKRIFLIALMAILTLTLLMPSAHAEDAGTAEDTFTDHLDSKDEVKWYEFTMAENGDVVIYIRGLQDHWDGYAYHWRCKVYGADRETLITYADVRGYSASTGPTVLSVPDLEAGTYYIQMGGVSYTNPLMTTFTTAPYEISFIRFYHSALAVYDGSGIQTFQKAGTVLWSFDGTKFLKLNDGECLGVLVSSRFGAVVPLLVSTDKEAVEYVISGTGKKVTAGGSWYDEESGIDYFYSDSWDVGSYTDESIEIASLPIPYVNSSSSKAKDAVKWVVNQKEAELKRAEQEKEEEQPKKESVLEGGEGSLLTERIGVIGIVFLGLLGVSSIGAVTRKR